jgi:hypothetical protein
MKRKPTIYKDMAFKFNYQTIKLPGMFAHSFTF